MRIAGLVAVAAALLAPASAAAPSAVVGSQRALVILATWGPQPWPRSEAEQALAEASAFLAKSSFGQLSLQGTVTPWLRAYPREPTCPPPEHERIPPPLTDGPRAAAEAAGFSVASYERLVYVVPETDCPWRGVGVGREVMLSGILSGWAIVHELGHTYGLAHARARICDAAACHSDEYGDPFSPMGHGLVDFGAFEKRQLGWIGDVVETSSAGAFEIGRPDVRTASPHALVVPTGRGEFWFEQRLDVAAPGLVARIVLADIPDDDLAPPTLFIENPTRASRPTIAPGEEFREAGVLAVRYSPRPNGRAEVRFDWIDRTRPLAPRLAAPRRVRVGRSASVAWASTDSGSGIASCVLAVDGRRALEGAADGKVTIGPLRRGTHRLTASCTDRAGNRSRASTARIRAVR
jgi:hypothetical protein